MEQIVCPRCGSYWNGSSLYCPGCGVTQAFLDRPANRAREQTGWYAPARPAPPVHLAVLVGLMVLGGGFVVQRFRCVEGNSLVRELLQLAIADHIAEPWTEGVTGRWSGVGRGTFRFAGKIRSPHALGGRVTGTWNPSAGCLAFHYELRPDTWPTGPAALTFEGRLERASGGWRRAGTMAGALPKRGKESGSPAR